MKTIVSTCHDDVIYRQILAPEVEIMSNLLYFKSTGFSLIGSQSLVNFFDP